MNHYKITARLVGVLILLATATYMLGSGLLDSVRNAPDYLLQIYPNRNQVTLGVLIQFVTAAANVGIGVLMFPILKKYSETIALGYVVTRIFDGAGVVISGVLTLLLIVLSHKLIQSGVQSDYYLLLGDLLVSVSGTVFIATMIALGLGSIPFCYLLYRTKLIPQSLSILGLIGYAALFIGSALELFGINLHMIHYAPGGLFELFLPIWLITKGFDSTTMAFEYAR